MLLILLKSVILLAVSSTVSECVAVCLQDIVSASPGPVWSALRKAVRREIKWTANKVDADDDGRRHLDSATADILDEMMDELTQVPDQPTDPLQSVYDAVMNMTCVMLIGDRYVTSLA